MASTSSAPPTIGRPSLAAGCLRSLRFDSIFVLGCAVLALASGLTVVAHPGWLVPILAFDVLILGSQHVIATYTRICCDKASFRRYRFLVLGVPWLIVLAVGGAFAVGGTALITTLYMYLQWFHYIGQGNAVEKMYACKSEGTSAVHSRDYLTLLAMSAVPLFGLFHRSLQKRLDPDKVYLTFDFAPLPVTNEIVSLTGFVAAGLCLAWVLRQYDRYLDGRLSVPHVVYVLAHWLIFLTGYYLIDDITHGWLVINVWHNAQYMLLVWLYNNNRFHNGVDPQARTLSYLSQSKVIALYFVVCLVLAGLFYKLVAVVDGWLLKALSGQGWLLSMNPEFFQSSGLVDLNLVPNSSAMGAAIAMLSYQVINQHHYVVDAVIWRVENKEHHQGLGLFSPGN